MDDKIKVLVVDDVQDIREYFEMILSREPYLEVVGTASSGIEAIQVASRTNPDVILMDIQMETRMAGIHATKVILKNDPDVKVIIITVHKDDELLFHAYNAGVMDYINKSDSITQIVESIQNVYKNKLMLRPAVAEKIVTEFKSLRNQRENIMKTLSIMMKLTNSEFEVLQSIYEGYTYRQIAESRFVSQTTIKSQVYSILKKFDQKKMKDVISLLKEQNISELFSQ